MDYVWSILYMALSSKYSKYKILLGMVDEGSVFTRGKWRQELNRGAFLSFVYTRRIDIDYTQTL